MKTKVRAFWWVSVVDDGPTIVRCEGHTETNCGTLSRFGEANMSLSFQAPTPAPSTPTQLPFRDEMEAFFGVDLSWLRVQLGADLAGLGADATQSGEEVRFSDSMPTREQVAHEVAHALQRSGASVVSPSALATSGTTEGVTAPAGAAEQEAKGAGRAMASGGSAPDLSAVPVGIARDEDDGTPLEQLTEAACGNFLGNVDESLCLQLINTLTPAERGSAMADWTLMGNLAGALNGTEMVAALNTLGAELKWKAYWLRRSDELDVGSAVWQGWLAGPVAEVRAFVGWSELFIDCYPLFGTNPLLVFGSTRGTPEWGTLLSTSPALVNWLFDSAGTVAALEEIGSPAVTDAQLPLISVVVGILRSWPEVIAALPRGAGMSPATRAALKRFKEVWGPELAKPAFEARFGHALESRWEKTAQLGEEATWLDRMMGTATLVDWSIDEIRIVWGQLDVLPDADVTGNTVLRSFVAIRHNWAGGFWASPDIQIRMGAAANPAGLEHTIRHEIGHSIHEGGLAGSINSWLQNDVGFWYGSSTVDGFREIIAALGGWPSTYNDASGTAVAFAEADKTVILDMLTAHSGGSRALSATGNPLPNVTSPTTDLDRKWAAMDARIQSCFALSATTWYNQYATWPDGRFYNHYYEKAYKMSAFGQSVVASTADNYTAMSEGEFFANCYAEYFEDPAGYTDHTLWGGSLPGPVKTFFSTVIVDHHPYVAGVHAPPAPPAPAAAPAPAGAAGSP